MARTDVRAAFSLVFGAMFAVEKIKAKRRKNAEGATHGVAIWIIAPLNLIIFSVRVVGVKMLMIVFIVCVVSGDMIFLIM